MICNYLKWDTEFFGIKIFKVETDKIISEIEMNELRKSTDGDLYYFFCEERQPYLEQRGAFLADEKISYRKNISDSLMEPDDNIGSYTGDLDEVLLRLGLQSGNFSRFKTDEKLCGRFTDLYTLWMKRSLTREIADEFFVYATKEENAAGFVTVKAGKDNCTIGLISVAQEMHGKGIGKKLLAAVDFFGRKRSLDCVNVVTQQRNVQACAFYEKAGFNIARREYIYHYYT